MTDEPHVLHTNNPGPQGDTRFLGYSIIIASVILAVAIIYSAQASFALSSALTRLPAGGLVGQPTVQATVGLQPTAAPTTQLQPGTAAGPSLAGVTARGNGSIALVEFSDFQCPFCSRAHPTVKRILEQDYAGKVKLYYKHFPLDSIHPDARKAGEAYECALDQGFDKAVQFMDLVFSDNSDVSVPALKTMAQAITGLNVATWESCVNSGSKAAKVEADFQEGVSVGVSGTPAFFLAKVDASGNPVGGWQQVVGAQPFTRFKAVIDALLAA
jgi:protein-disulfide isomerase